MSIELYIKNRLCDINSPESLGIRLKRQFINPAELSVKDAQMSYEITLPATPNNNEIFSHVNVEEVQGKFRIYEDARLYVDGILILDGKFRLSEITQDCYKGNLGVPAPLTAKDIFGETMMNQAGKWLIPFTGVDDITRYNTGGHDKSVYGEISPCIFPLVLYGLLPKENKSSPKNVLDKSVSFQLNDFPPSINVVHMLKTIFSNIGYNLHGSAIDDKRIKNLYVSYKNPNDYEKEWSSQKIKISGNWGKYKNGNIEKKVVITDEFDVEYPIWAKTKWQAACINLFNAENKDLDFDKNNPHIREEGNKTLVTIPYSGLYKLEFDAKIQVIEEGKYPLANLDETNFEVKVVRYSDDENLANEKLDNSFYQDNQDQTINTPDISDIFPQNGNVNFIDPKQNPNLLCGFAWGVRGDNMYVNPKATDKHNPMAIKHGRSWKEDTSFIAYSAVNSKSYVDKQGDTVNKYNIEIEGALIPHTKRINSQNGDGQISQIVWLEKGETISVISTSWSPLFDGFWYNHNITYNLSLESYIDKKEWIQINEDNNTDKPLLWNDKPTFHTDQIDLIKFLPSNIKVNDWIDNFSKTFNLKLTNAGQNNFELKAASNEFVNDPSSIIDIDKQADVRRRVNESLKLPYVYDFKFSIDNNEEGYYRTMQLNENKERIPNSGIDGGEKYYTESNETSTMIQESKFSYCWYKDLYNDKNEIIASVPVITDHEIWDTNFYDDKANSQCYDKTQRLWYPADTLDAIVDKQNVKVALVANEYNENQKLVLDYKNNINSITQNYFLLFSNASNFTSIDCILSAEEYNKLKYSLVKLNGDLYNIAEIDGYDPLAKSPSTLKLIRKKI